MTGNGGGRARVRPPRDGIYFSGGTRADGDVYQAGHDIRLGDVNPRSYHGDRAGRDVIGGHRAGGHVAGGNVAGGHQAGGDVAGRDVVGGNVVGGDVIGGHRVGGNLRIIGQQVNAPDYVAHARAVCPTAVAALLLSFLFWPAAFPMAGAAARRIRRTGESGRHLVTAARTISVAMLLGTVLFVVTALAMAGGVLLPAFQGVAEGRLPWLGTAEVRAQQVRIADWHGNPDFVPRSVTLGPGSTVTWTNERESRCRLVATSGELPAGEGRNPLRPGGTYRVVFDRPGMYVLGCDGSPTSGQTIVVR